MRFGAFQKLVLLSSIGGIGFYAGRKSLESSLQEVSVKFHSKSSELKPIFITERKSEVSFIQQTRIADFLDCVSRSAHTTQ